MLVIQIIILLFILFALSRVVLRYKDSAITRKEFFFWALFWLVAGTAVLLPQTTSIAASFVGIGRGVDLAIYVALILVFYILFRIFVRLEQMERNITKLVRKMGMEEAKEGLQKEIGNEKSDI